MEQICCAFNYSPLSLLLFTNLDAAAGRHGDNAVNQVEAEEGQALGQNLGKARLQN